MTLKKTCAHTGLRAAAVLWLRLPAATQCTPCGARAIPAQVSKALCSLPLLLNSSGPALAARRLVWPLQAWPWGSRADAASTAMLEVNGACSHQGILGTCSGLAALTRWQRAQRCFYLCASRHLHVLTDLDVTWRTACACALRARCAGYRTQPCLLHVPRPIYMQNTLFSPSVLACSAFLHEQMCSFSCPLRVLCPIHCPANHFCASKRYFFPWPLLCPELVSRWRFRTLVNRTV